MGTPDPGTYFRVIHEHNVVSMFTAPTALRAIRAEVSQSNDIATKSCFRKLVSHITFILVPFILLYL